MTLDYIQDLLDDSNVSRHAKGRLKEAEKKLKNALSKLARGQDKKARKQILTAVKKLRKLQDNKAVAELIVTLEKLAEQLAQGLNKAQQLAAAPDADPAFIPPTEFELGQNYPNPFNPETEIRFQLPIASHVVVRIFNSLGQEIRTLVDQPYQAGALSVRWDGKDNNGNAVSSGIYFYQLQANTFSQVKKMSLLR